MGFIALRVERPEAPRGSVEDRGRPGGETMRLTLHTDYALRVLIQVGLNDGKLTTIKDIAQTFGISKTHLMKGRQRSQSKGLSRHSARS